MRWPHRFCFLPDAYSAGMTEKDIYKQAVDELTTGNFDQALWAMVWTKAEGDDSRAKARYVETRVRQIKAEAKLARKRSRPPLSGRVPWRLIRLFGCMVAFSMINRSVATSVTFNAPVLRWDFYLIGIAGESLGLFLFPGFIVLVSGGNVWGFRVAYLVLFIAGCVSGAGGTPIYDPTHGDLVTDYCWAGF